MNSKLEEAVAIFNSLGWEKVTIDTILQQPLGTKEQQKIALNGLKNGDWERLIKREANSDYSNEGYIECNLKHITLYAIRIGVSITRALEFAYFADRPLLLPIIKDKGEKYATNFISKACVSRRRVFEHSSSVFGDIAVQLVDQLNLAIPESYEYMKDWAVYAALSMGLPAEDYSRAVSTQELPIQEQIKRRFSEHIKIGIAVNVPATGPFFSVFIEGVKQGWLSKQDAIEFIFFALDVASRPGDRKVWVSAIEELGISTTTLYERTAVLIPLLAKGESDVIAKIAPILIKNVDDELLNEVMIASFSAKVKSTKQLVLKTAMTRKAASDVAQLTPWLAIWCDDKDKSIAKLARQLANHWQLNYAQIEESHTQDIKYLWQKTPSLWTCPQFDWGKVTPQALTELASELVSRREFVCDTVAERFLAVANKIAYNDPQSARTSLAGVKPTSVDVLLNLIACWVKGIEPEGYWGADQKDMVHEVLHARNYVVCKNLDQLPCILSTPSKSDLSITVDDLCKRLEKYQKNKIHALEADIFLALTRLDTKTQSSKNLNLLKTLKVDVILQSGKKIPVNAGDMVLAYLDCPVKEVLLDYNEEYFWDIKIPTTPSLQYFPKRFDSLGDLTTSAFSVFPLWGDAAIRLSVSCFNETEHVKGLIFRQIAKRQIPLTAGVAMNILAAQRSASPRAIADIALAVNEAWERGLLIPGIADVFLLDWINNTPSKLVSLVATLSNIAHQGLLSVVWPILDELILASLKAPRLLIGTDEIVDAMAEFLPEVQFAVTNGLASPNQLDLLGLRALAEKTGSSRAISVAKYIITQLPDIKSVKSKNSNEVNITDFDKIWPKKERNIPVLDDGAIISIDLFEQSKSNSAFIFTLKLPDINDRVFHIVKTNWFFDLEIEGQCQAYPAPMEHPKFTTDSQESVYLHWDNDKKALLVSKYRNWLKNEDGPLSSTEIPALSNTLLIIVIGLLAQDGEGAYFAENYVLTSRIDEETVRRAILLFLKNPIVSPAKLIRSLEKEIKFLPLLWPILIECVRFVGNLVSRGEKIPVWTNRILDISLQYAAYLKEAALRGYIKDAKWEGLHEIASSKLKSTAVAKAKQLQEALNINL
ncbi:FimB/Mfa2 family fimbrial subunit [Gilliamella apis]|uniref:FimB/Mfa2 family fimbrial subunit n=1 Tax=Gilliamella apis TaxID=1970738 RepID=UPI000A34FC54|nr:FimB/Mfa2 family fimbrial subunit [Gilliamella apis]OTQ35388.1 hypothetical protein B6C84_06120 [Gilliamella apis]OTQ36671.1 hypothetical protein B6C88_07660 [Gilliamella apis]OTQ39623.1 hypothetical protein B6D26_08225 [Gilliamella apis]OTQ43167.1 hypothetical protein B6C94_03940 [Gilliamella apis]OTQ44673.1 hypothetical protein B6C86_09810 [Gilliamella apis]